MNHCEKTIILKKAVFLILFLLSTHNIRAQSTSIHSKSVLQPDTLSVTFKPKSPALASFLSISNSLIPPTAGILLLKSNSLNKSETMQKTAELLIAYGLIIGPSIGYFYVQSYTKALVGIGLRTLSCGVLVFGSGLGFSNTFGSHGGGSNIIPFALIITSTCVFLNSYLSQMSNASKEAKIYNHKHNYQFSLAPTYFYREKSLGLAMNVRF